MAAESRSAGEGDASCGRSRGDATSSEYAGLTECGRIEELGYIVRACVWILAGDNKRVACRSRSGIAGTRYVHRLPALQRAAPDYAPAADDRVGNAAAGRHEVLTFAERQLIRS